MAATLHSLPPEILLEVMSWLDWRSLHSLERVSARCRDAVTLHLDRLPVCRVTKADALGSLLDDAELAALWELLPRMTALRELHVALSDMVDPEDWIWRPEYSSTLLKTWQALVAASPCWLQLERLTIDWPDPIFYYGLDPTPAQLVQICTNCPRLTDVTLACDPDGECAAAVRRALPGSCTFRFTYEGIMSIRGHKELMDALGGDLVDFSDEDYEFRPP